MPRIARDYGTKACSKGYEFKILSQLVQHVSTELHIHAVRRSKTEKKTQQLMTQPVENEFAADMCKAFLSAEIPMNKINNPTIRQFLEKYTKKAVPSCSTLRRNIPEIYTEIFEGIRRYGPSKPHVLMSRELKVSNNSTISQLILDALVFLLPGERNEKISKKCVVLLSDAAAYMLLAGNNLKGTYPDLLHTTFHAHGMNRVAETINSLFPLANQPVLTDGDPGSSQRIFMQKILTELNTLQQELACLSANFTFIVQTITSLEDRKLTLMHRLIDTVKKRIDVKDLDVHKTVRAKLDSVLQKNPDFHKLCEISNVLTGKAAESQMSWQQ
ncbi:hypothetical protein Ocin01_17218 [Orchesella cincta]|uniref:Uncharacterized protein n=1 Tax=Orchesella cincta TaxID=48709 RepID=A0A1D2M956_ORCCI|nr:hypothetical protein Ocin01_17218 [Orchesella cincta]